MKYDLIIFDCDGTLVDSESLLNRALSEALIERGYAEYTTKKCMEKFVGHSSDYAEAFFKKNHPELIFKDLKKHFILLANSLLKTSLKPMPGALELLDKVSHITKSVASNGDHPIVKYSLEATGLKKHFHDNVIFTFDMIGKSKPDPALFLHAAKHFNVEPKKCLVIEDSVAGMQGASAAGMDTITMMHYPNAQVLAETKNNKVIGIIDNLTKVMEYL